MKKIIIIILMVLTMFTSLFAVSVDSDSVTMYNELSSTNDLIFKSRFVDVFGSEPYYIIYNTLTTKEIYLEFKLFAPNTTSIQILSAESELIEELDFELADAIETNRYFLKVSPNFPGETFYVRINDSNNDLLSSDIYIINDDNRESSLLDSIAPFTDAILDLIEINLSVWKLAFFVILVVLPLSFLALIVWAIMKIIGWAKKLNEHKNKLHNRRSDD